MLLIANLSVELNKVCQSKFYISILSALQVIWYAQCREEQRNVTLRANFLRTICLTSCSTGCAPGDLILPRRGEGGKQLSKQVITNPLLCYYVRCQWNKTRLPKQVLHQYPFCIAGNLQWICSKFQCRGEPRNATLCASTLIHYA